MRRDTKAERKEAWKKKQPKKAVPLLDVPMNALESGMLAPGSAVLLSQDIGDIRPGTYQLQHEGATYLSQIIRKNGKGYLARIGRKI